MAFGFGVPTQDFHWTHLATPMKNFFWGLHWPEDMAVIPILSWLAFHPTFQCGKTAMDTFAFRRHHKN